MTQTTVVECVKLQSGDCFLEGQPVLPNLYSVRNLGSFECSAFTSITMSHVIQTCLCVTASLLRRHSCVAPDGSEYRIARLFAAE